MALELRLFGVPTRLHLSFGFTIVLLWMLLGGPELGAGTLLIATAVIVQGVLLHELGHALVGRAFGFQPRIELLAFMGLTRWAAQRRSMKAGEGLLIAFAGPAVSLIVGGAIYAACAVAGDVWLDAAFALGPENVREAAVAAKTTIPAVFGLSLLVTVNLFWAVYNLVPILPLDGGMMMASFFRFFDDKAGQRWAHAVSLVLAGILSLLALVAQELFLVFLGGFLAWFNVQALRAERELRLRGVVAVRSREELLQLAKEALGREDAPTVLRAANVLLRGAENPVERDEAYHLMAWGQYLTGQSAPARDALDRLSGERDPDPALEGAVQLALGRPEEARTFFERALEAGPSTFVEPRYLDAVEQAGAFDASAAFVERVPGALRPEGLHALQARAYHADAHGAALGLGEVLFQRTRQPLSAFNVACVLARLGRAEEALGWLERARVAGFADVGLLDGDDDLRAVRSLPGWDALRARFG
ncbi:MAG: site-2 protease family protein [Myxococcota bacterium]